jgi:hypothetical protein
MPLIPKDWRNLPSTLTPLSAEALEDLEQRLGDYADTITGDGIPTSTGTAKGDTIAYTAASVPVRQAVGSKGHVPIADSSQATGLRYHRPMGWFNVVEEFGADRTGVASSSTAIQNAINAAEAAGGGTVYFPSGRYLITVVLTIPSSTSIRLQGAGLIEEGDPGTDLFRTGTNGIINATGTAGSRIHLQVSDMVITGGNTAGTALCTVIKPTASYFSNVHFRQATVQGFLGETLWNCGFLRCRWSSLGNGTGFPACILTGQSDGDTTQNTNTVDFISCEWENNTGTGLAMTGQSANQRSEFVNVIGGKAENNNAAIGTAPIFHFGRARSNLIHGVAMAVNQGSGAAILQTLTLDMNTVSDCRIHTGGAASVYAIDQQTGGMSVTGCYFSNSGAANVAGIALGAASGAVAHANNTFFDNAKRVQDNRTGSRSIGGGYFRQLYNTGAASGGSIGAGATNSLGVIGVTGAAMGDIVRVSHTGAVQSGIQIFGRVTSANTVTVYGYNSTTGTLTPPAGTLRVTVEALA